MADMIVAGAGTSAANGTYVETDTYNSRPRYYNTFPIQWSGSQWNIVGARAIIAYYSTDDVSTPDLCTTWNKGAGALPVPTVTAAGGGALRRTNMNAQMQSLTGGFN